MSVAEVTKPKARRAGTPEPADTLATPMFTMAQVCAAAGVSAETARTWFKRGVLSFAEDERLGHDPSVRGFGRMLTGYTAMVIAIMARLSIVGHREAEVNGYNLEAARDAAYRFVFSGDDTRRPCHLFPQGETALIIAKDGKYPQARVINLGVNGTDLSWRDIMKEAGSSVTQYELLMLDELWQSVFQRLGLRAQIEQE